MKMKSLILFITLVTSDEIFAAQQYNPTIFDQMPHQRIIENQINECKTQGVALGQSQSTEYIEICSKLVHDAFDEMTILNNKRITPNVSWSLCAGYAQYESGFIYPEMVKCMRVVNDVCPVKPDGEYVDVRQCILSMRSDYWLQNPKIDQPIQQ